MKTDIINKIDDLIQLSKDLDNMYFKNKLKEIKKDLLEEWNESDLYYEEIKRALNYEETMENLNNLKL